MAVIPSFPSLPQVPCFTQWIDDFLLLRLFSNFPPFLQLGLPFVPFPSFLIPSPLEGVNYFFLFFRKNKRVKRGRVCQAQSARRFRRKLHFLRQLDGLYFFLSFSHLFLPFISSPSSGEEKTMKENLIHFPLSHSVSSKDWSPFLLNLF